MSDFTTIQIRKETKQKLDFMKNENKSSYDNLIQNLLEQVGGTWVDDVITINREATALTLNYLETGTNKTMKYDISYQELKIEPVGTVFTANPEPNTDTGFVGSVAEIVFKKGDDVLLLVKELHYHDGVLDSLSSVVHVNLF